MPLSARATLPLITAALREDAALQDITSRAVIPAQARVRAAVIARAPGIVAGGAAAASAFRAVDSAVRCRIKRADGQAVKTGDVILTVQGRARAIFAAERVALNILGHLSGVATLTRAFVRAARPHRAAILDTRKTLPGLRLLEKYAVRCGGGHNHRMDLSDGVLIKTNHLRVLGHGAGGMADAIERAVQKARKATSCLVEVEVSHLHEFRAALRAMPDVILLDNWPIADIRKAVRLRVMSHGPRPKHPLLEVSGGVTLANVRAIAATGVDRISIGRLTHSAPALDVSLKVL